MKAKYLYVIIALLIVAVIGLGIAFAGRSGTKTSTVTPKSSPTATPTPAFKQFNAANVVAAVQKAGLPIESVQDQQIGGSAAPATEIESKSFVIPSVAPNGGQILIFGDQQGLDSKKAWFARFPDLAPYVYVKGNAMLQLNSGLPAVEAQKYQAVLEGLK